MVHKLNWSVGVCVMHHSMTHLYCEMPVYGYVTHYMRKCDDEDPTASSQNFELLSLVLTTSEAFLF